jgi:hypothetical protein
LRVDGDVLEIFRRRVFSERVPLAWLVVQVQPSIKGRLMLRIMSGPSDVPLYEVFSKPQGARGSAIDLAIGVEEEPYYRQFFTQVAQACGRYIA